MKCPICLLDFLSFYHSWSKNWCLLHTLLEVAQNPPFVVNGNVSFILLDPGNMESDQLFQVQGHLCLTMWTLLYEVVSCFDEYDSVLLELLIASYLVLILFQSVLKTY